MFLWISIIIATIAIQIPNIWAIKKFEEAPSLLTAFYIGLFCIPFSIISTTCYSYFYGFSFQKYSYPMIAVSVYGISLLVAFFVQTYILKNKEFIIGDFISMFLILSGLLVMIYRVEVTKLFT